MIWGLLVVNEKLRCIRKFWVLRHILFWTIQVINIFGLFRAPNVISAMAIIGAFIIAGRKLRYDYEVPQHLVERVRLAEEKNNKDN